MFWHHCYAVKFGLDPDWYISDLFNISFMLVFLMLLFLKMLWNINLMNYVSIKLLEYTWWKKESKQWTVSLVITHDNTSIVIPWKKYLCLYSNVDKYFDDLDY